MTRQEALNSKEFEILLINAFGKDKLSDIKKVFEFFIKELENKDKTTDKYFVSAKNRKSFKKV